ncbi:hypothetical protein EDC96DRAFT_570695 [Choanephora cucurbitarum]|nr:hypothetical protein EDC96DRAFT_570695 [Choanephora cucurbitarum]
MSTDLLEIKRKAWDVIFNDPNLSLNSLTHRAISGTVCQHGIRSICWKIFLGYLPTLEITTWSSVLLKERQHYTELKRKFIEEPAEKMNQNDQDQDLSDNNPLALNDNVIYDRKLLLVVPKAILVDSTPTSNVVHAL